MMNDAEYKKAVMSIRICVSGCSLGAIIISAVYTGLFANMWAQAVDLNDIASDAGYDDDVPAYNRCGGLGALDGDRFNTKWSVILVGNAILYGLLTLFSICQIVGTFWWPCCCCAALNHCLASNATFAFLIVTGVYRYSTEGEACAENS